MNSSCAALQRAWRELRTFDWQQLATPLHLGRWPALVRHLLLCLCCLAVVALILGLTVVALPDARAAWQQRQLLEAAIQRQQQDNVALAARQMDIERHESALHWIIAASSPPGVAQMMDVVRAALLQSGAELHALQLLELRSSPHRLQVSAGVRLDSLPGLWRRLMGTSLDFTLAAFELNLPEPGRGKAPIYTLNMELLVLTDAASMTVLPTAPKRRSKHHDGFLLRSDQSQPLYLLRDAQGRLTRQEE